MKTLSIITFLCFYVKMSLAMPRIFLGHEPYPEQVPYVIVGSLAVLGLIASLACLSKIIRQL